MTVLVAANIQDAQDAQLVNNKAVWVGGAVTGKESQLAGKSWIDVSQCPELSVFEVLDGEIHLGASLTLSAVETSEKVQKEYPLLHQAVAHIANPQIRSQATLAGALGQQMRCPYLKHSDYQCHTSGSGSCYAKGNEGFPFALLNNSKCSALGASTLGMVLLAMDAKIVIQQSADAKETSREWGLGQFFDVGTTYVGAHGLKRGDLITQIKIPKKRQGNKQKYFRLSSRRMADWAEIEIAVNAQIENGIIKWICIAAGAVAPQPLRLTELENHFTGASVSQMRQKEVWLKALPRLSPLKGQEIRATMFENSLDAVFQELFA